MTRAAAPTRGVVVTFPSERAFVVQFAADATEAGRAEHVVSGQDIRFHSPEELRAFMLRVLDAQRSGRSKGGRDVSRA